MKPIQIKDYTYHLPEERIAVFPLAQRDTSRLLFYHKGNISHQRFFNLPELLSSNTTLFFNNTKVIPARLHFTKETGAQIEIFLLNPHQPSDVPRAMQSAGSCSWKCTIGNLKRWKKGTTLRKQVDSVTVEAVLTDDANNVVEFSWSSTHTFAEIIQLLGEIPLPPYIHRKPDVSDKERYQTIYSYHEGAVAAPTAGLHFTEAVMDALRRKGVTFDFLTLHVGAGTFQPIKTEDASEHQMHSEQIVIRKENVEALLQRDRFRVAVGTTSMRTLESLYWYGVKLMHDPQAPFIIDQHDPYEATETLPASSEALERVLMSMKERGQTEISGYSSIYITPGYTFRICEGLITNFHQPGSTLVLLVAAFTGGDWKKIYHEAMENEYRFLSYGDSSLLIP